jgi:tetratricopeptide (TPR) repeat protein
MARYFAAEGQLEVSLRFCRAIRHPLEHADSLFEVGRVLRRNRDFAAAKNVFDQAVETAETLEHNDDKAVVLLQVAGQFERLGQKDEALSLVYRAVELAKPTPQNFEASKTLRGCARILAMWNRLSEAMVVAEAIDSRWPELRHIALEEVQGRGQWPVQPGVYPVDDE